MRKARFRRWTVRNRFFPCDPACQHDKPLDSGLQIHLVLDNYGTHKHPAVKEVAKGAAPLSRSFHAHQFFLAQSN
jgi:hypothetical protein